ncbi:hypothetical protein HYH02_015329 [Chlamydomonas schloesseri]|uniref:Uncharacterized protein n=1 Tax=Chlamydomonas schloesseri TaxID=2026947 RepID=A0A835VS43_9CHLO|nr:hypothetical protein HYH02_015329 [Chlamydomonas schloesseri]|eukprot:KAG2423371.1 hypothetical protein HYH02_015329 [Chlamydomonas schloesseri]
MSARRRDYGCRDIGAGRGLLDGDGDGALEAGEGEGAELDNVVELDNDEEARLEDDIDMNEAAAGAGSKQAHCL